MCSSDLPRSCRYLVLEHTQHGLGRIERHDLATERGQRDRHASGTGADIKNCETWFELRGCCETPRQAGGQYGAMQSVVGVCLPREVDAAIHCARDSV